eukprot:6066602-Pleurochrysis_carterae.AAC.1
MTSMDVLRARMVLGVICQVDGGLVIEVQPRRFLVGLAEFAQQSAEVSCFFGGLRGRYDFSLTGRQSYRR